MRFLMFAFCCLMIIPCQGTEQKSPQVRENIIEVTGEGVIIPSQDKINVNLLLKEDSQHISKAKMLIEQQSKQIKQIVAGLGISAESMQWQQINIRALYKEDAVHIKALEVPYTLYDGKDAQVFLSTQADNKNSEFEKFSLTRKITMAFSDHNIYQQFLQRAVSLGIKHIYPAPVNFEQYQQYYQQALEKAVLNAKAKAQSLALQSGAKLGSLFSLKEVTLPRDTGVQGVPLFREVISTQAITQEQIRARVIVAFKLIP